MPLHAIEIAPRTSPATGSIVLLHGYGASEEDLAPLAEMIDPSLSATALRAPLSLPWGGYAWYPIVPRGEKIDFDAGEVAAAVAQATEAIEAIAQRDGRPPILLGFSQGGGIALSVALMRPELCRAVVALSAVPPMVPPAQRAPRAALAKLPFFVAHGTRDPLLPLVYGHATRAALEESGCAPEWHEYPMVHEISPAELSDARAFVARLVR